VHQIFLKIDQVPGEGTTKDAAVSQLKSLVS